MKILVWGNDEAWNELTSGQITLDMVHAESIDTFLQNDAADIFVWLDADISKIDLSLIRKPLLINSVAVTLKEMKCNENVIRINGWKGFLKRTTWEVAGKVNDDTALFLKTLDKKIIPVADEPGLIAARVIAMIINEAYFAKEKGVSTVKEIDVAMKLGTNYPYGPFEWAGVVGIEHVYELLCALYTTDERYKPCLLLEIEAKANIKR